MELRKATISDFKWIRNVVGKKHLSFITFKHIRSDFENNRLYAVINEEKVLAIISLVPESDYGYIAIKRLCILNKKNQGKGIARFAIREIQKIVTGKIGATPWDDNEKMRYLLESEGFHLEYIFAEKWCFYVKECK